MTSKKRLWTEEEDQFLRQELQAGLSHEQIGVLLGRTKSSVMNRVQRLKITKKSIPWGKILNKEQCIELIKLHKTAETFDNSPELPGYKSVLKILGVSSWKEARSLAEVPFVNTGRYDHSKPTIFYLLHYQDINNRQFFKYGVTQRTIEIRYSGLKNYQVLLNITMNLERALSLEQLLETRVQKYVPLTQEFYSHKHGGYTECFASIDGVSDIDQVVLAVNSLIGIENG